ncbi:unnamed protein product [Onchocerca ochengi]|uniref:Uncharacterized protein n=1 Tax=Onchocerca ochengi TaxID=42157 RepID=A0A182DZT8_ONCOC|nr:unnamed protein product [Onchocerca ochengi]
MSTSSSTSLASATRGAAQPCETMHHHHECIELLMPENISNNLAMHTVLEEMPPQARTTHRPVILAHASDSSTSEHNETKTSGKI